MKNICFFLLLLALSSCGTFDRMKYRHLNKVPATPQNYISSDISSEFGITSLKCELNETDILPEQIRVRVDSTANVPYLEVIPTLDTTINESLVLVSAPPLVRREVNLNTPIRRDWSLLIGLLFLTGGIIALALCIFYYPFAGINFLWTVVFELFTLYAAWRLLGSGIVYFVTRFRSKRNYTER